MLFFMFMIICIIHQIQTSSRKKDESKQGKACISIRKLKKRPKKSSPSLSQLSHMVHVSPFFVRKSHQFYACIQHSKAEESFLSTLKSTIDDVDIS